MEDVSGDDRRLNAAAYQERLAEAWDAMPAGFDREAMDLGLSLIRAANRLVQDLEVNVHRPAGMTWAGFRVLVAIWVAGELSAKDLARASSISAASATSVLDTLEKYELIKRAPHAQDLRVRLSRLTQRGSDVVSELLARNNVREQDWQMALEPAERQQLIRLLHKFLTFRPPPLDPAVTRSWGAVRERGRGHQRP